MDNDNNAGCLIFLFIIATIWIWSLKSDIKELKSERDYYEDVAYDYSSKINSLNDQIETARGYAWESYQDMGEALENLYTE